MPGALDGILVIDLATPRAEMTGRVLAELGAEVVKVEPPEGCAARRLPPFEIRPDGSEGESLYWASVGLGKRSVVLDLADADARTRLRGLVASADVLIESDDPGQMAALGLGYEALATANPGLVYVSVTPFGQAGPLSGAPATDLMIEAAGGLISLQGDGDRPPIPVGFPQAAFHAGVQAATDVVIALNERARSGLGQHLDVSMQAAIVWTLMNATGYPPHHGGDPPGTCEARADPPPQLFPGLVLPRIWKCADGWAVLAISLPGIGPRTMQALMDWAESHGALPDDLRGRDWRNWIADVAAGALDVPTMMRSLQALGAFVKTQTKAEVQDFANQAGAIMSPVYTIPDLLTDPQLVSRDYWTEIGGRKHPGPFARLSGTPLHLDRPAPSLGADQALLDAADAPRRPQPHRNGSRSQAFDGLKVADFAWVGVGPLISKALADHGATVVHVESANHIDVLRLLPPFAEATPGLNRSLFMANFNTSKLGLAAELATPEGHELALRLINWADVVVESFTPGTMARLGLDYETLRQRRPDLVMLSTCLRGQTGPERAYTGFGGQGAALAGIFSVTGWPDRPPTGPWGAYTDFINPRFGVSALAAAVLHRNRTGEGQHIDLAQTEAGIRFIEPLVLDYTVNGRVAGPAGHATPYAAPSAVFRAAGKERYLAVAVETAAQWRALRTIAPLDDFNSDELHDLAARRGVVADIEAALAPWCAEHDAFDLAGRLRQAGVPAYAVLRPSDLHSDPQLTHRGFFVTLEHAEAGPIVCDGHVTHFSATPGALRHAAPCLGQHNDRVLREFLALDEDAIVRYAAAGALT